MNSILNLSSCIYIGNTTSIDKKILSNYCSRFGTIRSILFEKEKFCDFHLVEFSTYEQSQRFLNENNHEIDQILLDVKSYKHLLIHHDILNIERKFYIGPILNSKDEQTIVKFYKNIDPTLQYGLSEQDNQVYLLIEFSNRQSITGIFERQTMPIGNEDRRFSLYKPIHPKIFVNKLISMKNKQNQIIIRELNEQITEAMLIDYFHKRAPVIACHFLSNHPKSAILEFNDKKTVKKILEIPNVRLQGINLSLSQSSRHLASLLSSTDDKDDTDDDDDYNEIKTSPREHIPKPMSIQNQLPPTPQRTFPPPIVTEPVFIPSPPQINECGWSSPPRAVITSSLSTEIRAPLNPPTNSLSTDAIYRSTTIDPDVKPIPKARSNNILHFFEQIQTELDDIKVEYKSKFDQDQSYIEREINLLINEERQTFNKLNRYLIDHRKRAEQRQNNPIKRKYSSSPTNH